MLLCHTIKKQNSNTRAIFSYRSLWNSIYSNLRFCSKEIIFAYLFGCLTLYAVVNFTFGISRRHINYMLGRIANHLPKHTRSATNFYLPQLLFHKSFFAASGSHWPQLPDGSFVLDDRSDVSSLWICKDNDELAKYEVYSKLNDQLSAEVIDKWHRALKLCYAVRKQVERNRRSKTKKICPCSLCWSLFF